ncbi:DNA recombination protein RmuC [compost metagenome]
MYDKFVGFLADLEKIGKSIDGARETYEEARKKLTEGKDNLVRKVERLKELGAKTTKELPDNLLE